MEQITGQASTAVMPLGEALALGEHHRGQAGLPRRRRCGGASSRYRPACRRPCTW